MKHIIAIALSFALLLTIANPSFASESENERLSDMTESECIEFIKQYGITIPSDYDEATWGPFIKAVIETVERNPEHEFSFSYSVTLSFANSIKAAVNDYYGISSTKIDYTSTQAMQ